MTALFHVRELGITQDTLCPITMWAWRGCCIEVFSMAEHSVADCLISLEQAGVHIGKQARNPSASKRLKALSACIKDNGFGGHGKAALKCIAEWERVYERRALLAHGHITATAEGLTIRHITYDGTNETRLEPRPFSRDEMRDALAEIKAAQKALHDQLGQIKSSAKHAKPSPGG